MSLVSDRKENAEREVARLQQVVEQEDSRANALLESIRNAQRLMLAPFDTSSGLSQADVESISDPRSRAIIEARRGESML